MTNKEFRVKYMHENDIGSYRYYDLTHEEYDKYGTSVTKEMYNKWHDLWTKQQSERRAIEDDMTYGQFRTFCVLSARYGLGFYKHNPEERWNMFDKDDSTIFDDYDSFVEKCVDELDKRFIVFIKTIEEERNKDIDNERLGWYSI